MVGSPQDIQCIVSTVSGVELSSVMISWMGPGGESIANDSRVTISPTTSSDNNYASSLQFIYLMEGDEGMYTCNVMILETSASDLITIYNPISKYNSIENLVFCSRISLFSSYAIYVCFVLTMMHSTYIASYVCIAYTIYITFFTFFLVPVPSIDIIALNNQTVGQSLTLESTITTVRGITSRVDIVWSSNGVELKRFTNANTSLTINDSELYKDTFNIPLLSTSDDGRVFQCEMIIMTTPSTIVATNNITLDVTGKFKFYLTKVRSMIKYSMVQILTE